jgi:hypothetical protein
MYCSERSSKSARKSRRSEFGQFVLVCTAPLGVVKSENKLNAWSNVVLTGNVRVKTIGRILRAQDTCRRKCLKFGACELNKHARWSYLLLVGKVWKLSQNRLLADVQPIACCVCVGILNEIVIEIFRLKPADSEIAL